MLYKIKSVYMETLRIEHHYFVCSFSACSIIAGVETLHMIHKGQAGTLNITKSITWGQIVGQF